MTEQKRKWFRIYQRKFKEKGTINAIELISGGKAFFDLIVRLIEKAEKSIHLQTYIFNDDETGHLVADALKAAAKRGVSVHLLADGYASQALPKKFIASLKDAGVHFRFFEPVFRSKRFYFGRRVHHKIFVADARYALVTGRNIADRYNDLPGIPAWLDFGLYVEGEVAKELCVLCWKTWKNYPQRMPMTSCEEQAAGLQIEGKRTMKVEMVQNDWVRGKNEIAATYVHMFRTAKKSITIMCSYFLPNRRIRHLLDDTARRGVKVRVIFAGHSDVSLVKHAERWLYDWLWRSHIEFFEYQPTVLHAKLGICDQEWITLGSFNVNNISAYATIELNLNVYDEEFAKQTELLVDEIVKNDCIPITKEKFIRTRNLFSRFVRWASFMMINVLFTVFTFYYKQKE